jgi:polyisoprenoid-binding protein YceI
MENQQVMPSPVTRSAVVVIPAAGTSRVAGHRLTIPAATRHLFGLTVHGPFGMADGEIHIADPVRESLARATICAASFSSASPSRDPAVRSARFPAAGAYPDMTFTSERVDQAGGHWPACGRCRCAGRTSRVELAGQGPRPVAGGWLRVHGLFLAGGGGR